MEAAPNPSPRGSPARLCSGVFVRHLDAPPDVKPACSTPRPTAAISKAPPCLPPSRKAFRSDEPERRPSSRCSSTTTTFPPAGPASPSTKLRTRASLSVTATAGRRSSPSRMNGGGEARRIRWWSPAWAAAAGSPPGAAEGRQPTTTSPALPEMLPATTSLSSCCWQPRLRGLPARQAAADQEAGE